MHNKNAKPGNNRILVVDDEQQIRQFYADLVPKMFPELSVDLAVDGLEAVSLFKDFQHALIIMDVIMPRMDGITAYELITTYCKSNAIKNPVVIFCTGYAPPEKLQKLVFDEHTVYLFMKPVSLTDILKVIQEHIPMVAKRPDIAGITPPLNKARSLHHPRSLLNPHFS